jgi:hypothetical protein
LCQLDAAGLSPSADQNLRLDHNSATQLLGDPTGIFWCRSNIAGGYRYTLLSKEPLGLILV